MKSIEEKLNSLRLMEIIDQMEKLIKNGQKLAFPLADGLMLFEKNNKGKFCFYTSEIKILTHVQQEKINKKATERAVLKFMKEKETLKPKTI